MRTLKAAVVIMGVLIVAGVVTIAATIVHRVGGGGAPAAAAPIALDEPAGTRIAGVSALPDRLTVTLQGGGPDRIVVVDLRDGRILARVSLTH